MAMGEWLALEKKLRRRGFKCVCGVDEAGRGPLAGPVVAAAVILPANFDPEGIADSKKLTPQRRQRAYEKITAKAHSFAVAASSVAEIDEVNILAATLLAMRRAITGLVETPDYVIVDGNRLIPDLKSAQETVIGGDGRVLSVACASILAKVERDRIMQEYHQHFPEYGFDQHKGYPTRQHRLMIAKHGVIAIHRRSFNLLGKDAILELNL